MKTSAKVMFVIAGLALAGSPSAPATEINHDISLGGLVFMPQDGLFSTGLGGELTYRYWLSPAWGLSATFGATHIGVKHDRLQVAPGTSGSFDIIPLGGDVSCNIIDLDPVRVNVNLGLGYAIVSSSASCLNIINERVDMKLDDIYYGTIGLDGDWALTQHWGIFAAAGYRHDFSKNKIQTDDGPLRATEFSGFNLQLGLRCNF
jgi:hypothetical protein